MTPVLSILTPSITERMDGMQKLLNHLGVQVKDKPIELLCLVDNCKRSIGMKRDALVQASQGRYIAFVDDDDWVSASYVDNILLAAQSEPDVISFDSGASIDGGNMFRVRMSLEYKQNEQAKVIQGQWQDVRRPPWHVCAWRGDLARQYRFPDRNYGEDWEWVRQFVGQAQTEVRIDRIMHYYNFDKKVTRAHPIK